MKTTSLISISACFALTTALRCETTLACPLENEKIVEATAEEVGTFKDNGKFDKAVKKGDLLPARIVSCNEELGLLEVEKPDGTKVWIDPLEVKLPKPVKNLAQSSEICQTTNLAKNSDSKQVVSSGAQSDAKCDAVAK